MVTHDSYLALSYTYGGEYMAIQIVGNRLPTRPDAVTSAC